MAQLKMAPYLHKQTVEAKFPTLRAELQPPKNLSRLERLRHEYQERALREKEQKLISLTQHDMRTLHYECLNRSPPWPSEERAWASNWTACKRSAGVDRSHPLKPILHRKSPLNTASPPHTVQRSPSANMAAIHHPPAFPGPVRSKSGSSHPEPWVQLQKTETNLEAEIRRKETLLREKLRRTQEELRRIQQEKEEAEQEERRVREIKEARAEKRKTPKDQQYRYWRSELEDDSEERVESCGISRITQERSHRHARNRSAQPSEVHHAGARLEKEHMVGGNDLRKVPHQPSPLSHPPVSSRTQHFQTPGDPGPPARGRPEAEEGLFPDGGVEDASGELVPCGMCGRRFMAQRLEKHTQVCQKMQNSKRKVFDSSKARAKGTELEQFLQTNGKAPASAPQPRRSSWRQKHDSFLRTIRQAREVQQVIARGGKLSDLPPPPPEENPDYIACPHCSRRFAPRAAERHIPKCETIKSKPRPPPSRRR